MTEVHQIVNCLTPGDAVSNYVLYLQNLLRGAGFKSEIFADVIAREYDNICRPIDDYLDFDSPEKMLFAHYSIASRGMLGLLEFRAKKVLFYHNVTPYHYWTEINSLAAFHCLRGRTDLFRIIPHVQYGIAFSDFSLRDLHQSGLKRTALLPLSLDVGRIKSPPDKLTLAAYESEQPRILMVGRVVPNKKLEEAIRIVSLLPDVRLIIAGSWENSVSYYYALRDFARSLKVKCDFLGSISQEQLTALYQIADVLLVLSEHEGFCMPILEAFHYNLPVIAYAAAAIPETAKDGAILFKDRDCQLAANLISRVLKDDKIRYKLQIQGREVLRQHQQFPVKETLLKIIQEVASSTVEA